MTDAIACLFPDQGTRAIDWATACAELSARDPALGVVIAKVGGEGFPPHRNTSTFETLTRSIVYQQLSGKAAATIFGRFRGLFPEGDFPAPAEVLRMSHGRLRKAGLSEAKARAIRDLALHADRGEVGSIDELRAMDPEDVIEQLTVVRGVGRWTVQMLLLFRIGHPDVLPAHDLGIRKGLARISRRRELPEPEAVMRRGERWRPWRSVASWYLWRATELPPARSHSRSR
jgi:3-methyladenine DNA glycosylase/8-oxoguanine DNA glycosylase